MRTILYTGRPLPDRAIDPPDEEDAPECPECGKDMEVISSGNRAGNWWLVAVCECGHRIDDNNFE
jgi:hypothetical protein